MKKLLKEQLKDHMSTLRLTERERDAMRLALGEHMCLHPPKPTYSWSQWLYSVRFASPALAAVLLCAGTAYAAQGALPGDLLYPIKIHVNESVEVALATTPQARANVEAQLAQRRVTEGQELAARGELNATTTAELEANFNEHATEAIAFAQKVSGEEQFQISTTSEASASTTVLSRTDQTATSTFTGQLNVFLTAQGNILNTLGTRFNKPGSHEHDRQNESTTTAQELQKLHQHQGTLPIDGASIINLHALGSSTSSLATSTTLAASTTSLHLIILRNFQMTSSSVSVSSSSTTQSASSGFHTNLPENIPSTVTVPSLIPHL